MWYVWHIIHEIKLTDLHFVNPQWSTLFTVTNISLPMFCLLVPCSTTGCDRCFFFTCALVHLRCFINTNKNFQSYLDLIEKNVFFFPWNLEKREHRKPIVKRWYTHITCYICTTIFEIIQNNAGVGLLFPCSFTHSVRRAEGWEMN